MSVNSDQDFDDILWLSQLSAGSPNIRLPKSSLIPNLFRPLIMNTTSEYQNSKFAVTNEQLRLRSLAIEAVRAEYFRKSSNFRSETSKNGESTSSTQLFKPMPIRGEKTKALPETYIGCLSSENTTDSEVSISESRPLKGALELKSLHKTSLYQGINTDSEKVECSGRNNTKKLLGQNQGKKKFKELKIEDLHFEIAELDSFNSDLSWDQEMESDFILL